jgi:hypothetical protein
MRIFLQPRPKTSKLLRNVFLFVGLFAAVGLALIGAVVALGLLALGTIAHVLLSFLRSTKTKKPDSGNTVIDAEFTVVRNSSRTPPSISHTN